MSTASAMPAKLTALAAICAVSESSSAGGKNVTVNGRKLPRSATMRGQSSAYFATSGRRTTKRHAMSRI